MRSLALLATIYAAALGTSSALVDAETITTISVDACGDSYDQRTSYYGIPENTLDSSRYSRWSCKWDILDSSDDDEGCCLRYYFEEPQDIVEVRIAFYKGEENTRTLNVYVNGKYHSKIKSSGDTNGYQTFDLNTDETSELKLTFNDHGSNSGVWLGITEVKFMVD